MTATNILEPASDYIITAAAAPVMTPTEAKAQLRVEHDAEDTLITGYSYAADAFVQAYTGQALMTQTLSFQFTSFCQIMMIVKGPLQSISSIKYIDIDGAQQTLDASAYVIEAQGNRRVFIRPADGETWPDVSSYGIYNVIVEGVFGYATADDIDKSIKQAIAWLIGHMYQNREAVIVGTSNSALELGVSSSLISHVIW